MIRSKTHVKTNFCLHIQVLLTIRMGLRVLGQNHGKDLLVSFDELFIFRNTRNKDGKNCKINTLPYRCSSRPHPILYCFLYNLLLAIISRRNGVDIVLPRFILRTTERNLIQLNNANMYQYKAVVHVKFYQNGSSSE